MKIETYGQESPVKGLRLVKFAVVSNRVRRWIDEDGSLSFRYSVDELKANDWIKLDEREVVELDTDSCR